MRTTAMFLVAALAAPAVQEADQRSVVELVNGVPELPATAQDAAMMQPQNQGSVREVRAMANESPGRRRSRASRPHRSPSG